MNRFTPYFQAAALVALILFFGIMTAFAQTANTATINFTAPTTRVGGGAIVGSLSFNVYQGVGKGTTKTLAGSISTTGLTINSGLQAGTDYCWQVTSMETISGAAPGPESARSNEACKAFPPGTAPNVMTITVQ
jgi:hypothetical protein